MSRNIEFHEANAKRKMLKVIRFSRLKRHVGAKRITPSTYSHDAYERSLGQFLQDFKSICQRPKRHRVFHPSVLEVLKENDALKLIEPMRTKEKALAKLKDVINWIVENNRFPRSVGDSVEVEHNRRLSNLKEIKKGALASVWYPEYDEMMASLGRVDYFGPSQDVMISSDIDDLCRFYKKYGKTPTQLSSDSEERRLYRKLIKYRQSKSGKNTFKWNPDIDLIIKSKKIKNFFNSDR